MGGTKWVWVIGWLAGCDTWVAPERVGAGEPLRADEDEPCVGEGVFTGPNGVDPLASRHVELDEDNRLALELWTYDGVVESITRQQWDDEVLLHREYERSATLDVWDYDQDGKLLHYTNDLIGVRRMIEHVYTYDALGNLATLYAVHRRSTELQTYVYDQGELVRIEDDLGPLAGPDGVVDSVTYVSHPAPGVEVHESDRDLDGIIDATYRWERTWDDEGRLTYEASYLSDPTVADLVQWFDEGRLVEEVQFGASERLLTYDHEDRLVSDVFVDQGARWDWTYTCD